MCTFWILVAVTLQLGYVTAEVNIKLSPRSSAHDVIAIVQHASSPIYLPTPGVYQIEYNDGQERLTCDLCEAGHFLIKHCDTEDGTTCGQCPHNFYMPFYNNGDRCRSCGDTCDGDLHLVTLQECSPTAPRRCACQPGTIPVLQGSNGPGMCKTFEMGTTTSDPKHGNVTKKHEETTEKTTTSVTNNTATWDLDSSMANDTLSYDLAEIGPIVGPLAGLTGFVVLVIIGAWCRYQSTSEKEEDFPDNKNIDLVPVFEHVADHVGKDWRPLARRLPGIKATKSDLDSIEYRHRGDFREMAYEMLLEWKEKNGGDASLKGLQQGLRALGSRSSRRLAKNIGKKQWPEMV